MLFGLKETTSLPQSHLIFGGGSQHPLNTDEKNEVQDGHFPPGCLVLVTQAGQGVEIVLRPHLEQLFR